MQQRVTPFAVFIQKGDGRKQKLLLSSISFFEYPKHNMFRAFRIPYNQILILEFFIRFVNKFFGVLLFKIPEK